jgi:type I restriction enzyme M protein
MRKNLGKKSKELSNEDIESITRLFADFKDETHSMVFDNDAFGYRQLTVERPLRRRFVLDRGAILRLESDKAFLKLDSALQESVLQGLSSVCATKPLEAESEDEFLLQVESLTDHHGVRAQRSALRKSLIQAVAISDPMAPVLRDRRGELVSDAELRDTENVPFTEDPEEYFEREVLPFWPDAWVASEKTRVGYEIPFGRFFYAYVPPRELSEIDDDIRRVEDEIFALVGEVAE